MGEGGILPKQQVIVDVACHFSLEAGRIGSGRFDRGDRDERPPGEGMLIQASHDSTVYPMIHP